MHTTTPALASASTRVTMSITPPREQHCTRQVAHGGRHSHYTLEACDANA